MRESSVDITQSLRKNRAKNLQNFRKFGAPRAQKLRALGHRALRMLHNVIESLPSQHCIQIRKKQTSSVGVTQILRPTRAKKLQISRKFSARCAHKNCVNSASVVSPTAEFCCSSFPSRCAFECKIKRESSVEIAQSLRKNRAKNLQNFRKFGAPRAQKLHALGHRALHMLHNVIES